MYKYQTYTLAIPHVSPLYFIFLYPSMNTDIINALSTYWFPYFFLSENIDIDNDCILIKKDHIVFGVNNGTIIPYLTPIALFKIINDIIRRNSICEKNWHILHASSYDINKKTFIFTGESGAGKSTLIAYLLFQNPKGYNGDDFVIVNYENNILEPNSRNIFLRQSSVSILQSYNHKINLNVKQNVFGDRFYIEPTNKQYSGGKNIDYILNLRRCDGIEYPIIYKIEDPTKLNDHSLLTSRNVKNNIVASLSLFSKCDYFDICYNNLDGMHEFLKHMSNNVF